ncbi:MAG TPA: OsmC family protein [Cyclobacteriaceae bacterium]|nr:OsmC family protein [Cyclobacteriaceae bacterium]
MEGSKNYRVEVKWTGNQGLGTSDYKSYERSHSIMAEQKPMIYGSSDPSYRGDSFKYNPEELLVASLSSCHMLWYLHLCAEAGVVVVDYVDHAVGILAETPEGSGYFKQVFLNPEVTVSEARMARQAMDLHKTANKFCFIANSVNFEVLHLPTCKVHTA